MNMKTFGVPSFKSWFIVLIALVSTIMSSSNASQSILPVTYIDASILSSENITTIEKVIQRYQLNQQEKHMIVWKDIHGDKLNMNDVFEYIVQNLTKEGHFIKRLDSETKVNEQDLCKSGELIYIPNYVENETQFYQFISNNCGWYDREGTHPSNLDALDDILRNRDPVHSFPKRDVGYIFVWNGKIQAERSMGYEFVEIVQNIFHDHGPGGNQPTDNVFLLF